MLAQLMATQSHNDFGRDCCFIWRCHSYKMERSRPACRTMMVIWLETKLRMSRHGCTAGGNTTSHQFRKKFLLHTTLSFIKMKRWCLSLEPWWQYDMKTARHGCTSDGNTTSHCSRREPLSHTALSSIKMER